MATALWNLALILEQLGERNEAEKLYAKLPEKNPEWEDASFRLGFLRLQRGDFRGSAEAFERCLERRPECGRKRVERGIAYGARRSRSRDGH